METDPIQRDPLKRAFDIIFSISILLFFFPLFFILALLVGITSEGPIFYKSRRLGRGGKTIECLKFRTMYQDAEEKLETLLASNHELQTEWNAFYKLKTDPRITPIGLFLRKSSLDELPQFWNVLKGDLSVVGPRAPALVGPPQNYHLEIREIYGEYTKKILTVKPGITGIWQISGRSDISLTQKREIEAKYAETRTFLKDLIIVAKTIPAVIFSRGAC